MTPPRLSQQAAARQAALLETLRPVVARRGVVRRVRNAAGAISLCGAVAVAAWFALRPSATPKAPQPMHATSTPSPMSPSPTHRATIAQAPQPTATPRVVISIVQDDPGILARTQVSNTAPVTIATDAELQDALRELGQDPGLVKIGGTMMLASQLKGR